jgi:hypothetical protein
MTAENIQPNRPRHHRADSRAWMILRSWGTRVERYEDRERA